MMNKEKRALLDHAERCRRIADELTHAEAALRLRSMADEYEARAASVEAQDADLSSRLQARKKRRGGSDLAPSG